MEQPTDEFRQWVGRSLDRLTEDVASKGGDTDYAEEALEEILLSIQDQASGASEAAPAGDPFDDLAAVDAWAGLASYAVARFYAPTSPWPWHKGGWDKAAPKRLREIAEKLRPALETAARAIGAASWSISVGFPWGVSVSVSWP
jgi:hypothetical protein